MTDWVAEEEAWIMAGDESTFQEWLDRPRPSWINWNSGRGAFVYAGEQPVFQGWLNRTGQSVYQQQLQAILNPSVGQPIYLNRQPQRGLLSGLGGGLLGL